MADSDALTNKFHGALKKLQLFILDFDAVALIFIQRHLFICNFFINLHLVRDSLGSGRKLRKMVQQRGEIE